MRTEQCTHPHCALIFAHPWVCFQSRLSLCLLVFFTCQLLNPSPVTAQYYNAGPTYGVQPVISGSTVFGSGVSVHDFDGDGLDDLSFGTTNDPPFFFRNTGNGFEQIPFEHPSPALTIKSILWVDIDNDGDKDLLLTYEFGAIRLYENIGDLELIDITEDSGILVESGIRYSGASFGDYDNDGYLDFYVCKFYNMFSFEGEMFENKLYRNNGDNTFTDVTYEANASVGVNASFMATWIDVNYDGYQDIFVVNDRLFNRNHLLLNNGDGTFTEVAEDYGVANYLDAMGCSLGDYNNDLLLDFYVANSQNEGNHLYRQNPDFTYDEVGEEANVQVFDLCWSGLWMDYNNNGWLDLHVGTEFTVWQQFSRNPFFVNNGNGTFTESGVALGLGHDHYSSFGTAHGDWNNDGYSDFIVNNKTPYPCLIWENITPHENNYLAVTLEGTVSNRDAIGSFIYCYTGDDAQMRYTACGENFLGQNSQRKLFGIGQAEVVDSVVVKWLSGHIDVFYDLEPNQTYHIIEGSSLSGLVIADNNQLCQGTSIEIHAANGLNHQWSNGQSNVDFITVTEAGDYSYTAYTELGIVFYSDTLHVLPSGLPDIQLISQVPSCVGFDDGVIALESNDLTDDLIITLNGLTAGWYNDNLPPGLYTVQVEAQSGCQLSWDTFFPTPIDLQGAVIPGSVPCHGGVGTAQTIVFGGNGAISFDWGGFTANTLPAGEHTLTIFDEHGCSLSFDFVMTEPQPLSLEIEFTDNVLSANPSGGTPPYSYQWLNSSGNYIYEPSFQVAASGLFFVTVTDANDCTITNNAFVSPTQIAEHVLSAIEVYPNPTSSELNIQGDFVRPVDCALFDLAGRKVHQSQHSLNSIRLSLNHLSIGTYLLQLSSDGSIFHNQKIVKMH